MGLINGNLIDSGLSDLVWIEKYQKLEQQLSQLQQEKEDLITRIDNTTKYVKSLSSKGRDCQIYWDIKQEILSKLKESNKYVKDKR